MQKTIQVAQNSTQVSQLQFTMSTDLYSADQIKVPEQLPAILKAYTKEVIRFNPSDIVAFSRDYFASLANGDIERFLSQKRKEKELNQSEVPESKTHS